MVKKNLNRKMAENAINGTIIAHAVTANRLGDGSVAYLTGGGWSARFGDCLVADDAAGLARLNAAAAEAEQAQIVVGAYVFDVAIDGGEIRPVRRREAIRAAGPTVGLAADAGQK